ncbi:MAG: ATP-binding protein [Mycoplasmataceae bacterium]|nr:ATP-binding protein [Mycoplasmataceae bacterium]
MLLERNIYLKKLCKVRDAKLIKTLTGPRRCGKTTVFLQFIKILKKDIRDYQIIYINFDKRENKYLIDIEQLENYIDERIIRGIKMYLFLDEISNVNGFEDLVAKYFKNKHIDIYLSGSNSYLSSTHLKSKFFNRMVSIKMLPFTFHEFYDLHAGNEKCKQQLYKKYCQCGGIPILMHFLADEELVEIIVNSIIDGILGRHVIPRFNIRNILLLKKVLEFAMINIGKYFDANDVVEFLVKNKFRHTSCKTIETYIKSLQDCFMLVTIQKYDIIEDRADIYFYKIYALDINVRNLITNRDYNFDFDMQLENIVLINVFLKFQKIYTGVFSIIDENENVEIYEVDFVCINKTDKLYIQVCENLADVEQYLKKTSTLQKLDDGRKLLLTNSKVEEQPFEDIEIKEVVDFLLE